MSRLTDAIEERMVYLVFSEGRPFCFKDFEVTNVGEVITPAHGSLCNLFSKWKTAGKIIRCFNSGGVPFYSLAGHRLAKNLMTPDHTGVRRKADVLYDGVISLSYRKHALHDIRLPDYGSRGVVYPLMREGLGADSSKPRHKTPNVPL